MRLWFPRPYEHTTHGGKVVDWLTKCALLDLEWLLGYELTIEQGSYNHNAVAVSAGTHNGGGAVDLAPFEADRKVELARSIGFMAFHRKAIPGVWAEHVHMVLMGDARMSAPAAAQVRAYLAGHDGLADNGPDTGPRQYVGRRYTWPGGRAAKAKVRRNQQRFHPPAAKRPTALTAIQVYELARKAGLEHDPAVIATSIAWAESGLNPGAVGDVGLQDATWGPSIGLWQVRSLKAELGSGSARDADRLKEPAFNAHAMFVISGGGRSWSPWSTYTSGAYRQFVLPVRVAVARAAKAPHSLPTKAAGKAVTPTPEGKTMTEINQNPAPAAPVVEQPAPAPVVGATSDAGAAPEPPAYVAPNVVEPDPATAAAPSTDLTAPVPVQPVAEAPQMVLGQAPAPAPAPVPVSVPVVGATSDAGAAPDPTPAAATPAPVGPAASSASGEQPAAAPVVHPGIVQELEKIAEAKIGDLIEPLIQEIVNRLKDLEMQKLEQVLAFMRG